MQTNSQIDIVLIGVNVERSLELCLKSIIQSSFRDVAVFYVDGGSTDTSIEIANRFSRITVIELNSEHPCPGLQRNVGWKSGTAPFVQFLDSDTILHPEWLNKGLQAMHGNVGAVRGNRIERYPQHSSFNWIANLEWNVKPGDCKDFGGDVLIRRMALEETNGYDEELVGGEDPELAQRIRNVGWKIIQLDEKMTDHDLAMTTVRQYIKRAYRTGYGYAAVFTRHSKKSYFWYIEIRRIIIRAGGFAGLTLIAIPGFFLQREILWALLPAFLLLLFPRIFRIRYFAREKNISHKEARIYAWHCSLVVLPEFFGILRFFLGAFLNAPLKNQRKKLRTGNL